MKSDLVLKRFITNAVPGTMNQKELRTFFGGKILYSEDNIYINDDAIKFSQVQDQGNSNYNKGYQYFDINSIPDDWETTFSENLTDLKNNNQSISLLSQTSSNMTNNTRWQITINGSAILKDYLFFRLKEQRVFKMINAIDTYSNDINNAIYDYITNNVFGIYRLSDITFYVKYYDITSQNIYSNIKLQYNPKFNVEVYNSANLTNANIIDFNAYNFDTITIQYNQSKPSSQYSFDYYFDLNFSKI